MECDDNFYMRRALALARRGLGKTSPNPVVGALFLRDGMVIGEGYHRLYGGNHAEINAILAAQGDISRATLYVTLEPCCHHGKKTPPCLDALLKHDLARVVIGTADPNPQVNGRSIAALRERGIQTRVGVLEEECRQLNEVYFKHIQTGMPFVTVKYAQTLDGRIAAATGDSRWISSGPSLKLAHRLRSLHDSVLIGIGTALSDDPQLTVRLAKGRNPVRVVIDASLRIANDAQVLQDQNVAPTIVATTGRADQEKVDTLTRTGVKVITVPEDREGKIDLKHLLKKLGEMNISSVLVEGGAAMITTIFRQQLADKLVVITAPKLMGKGIEAIGDLGTLAAGDAMQLSFGRTYRSGDDLVIEARPRSAT
jgi:diaminohydroxyphosphoribosylaminopyrimidine deaminase/5-amino-6-(5-phosphoribosylamino)uracil reductase